MHAPGAKNQAGRVKARSSTFYRIRLALLLSLLAVVAGYTYYDHEDRASRNAWQRTLKVAVVLLVRGDVDPTALDQVEGRLKRLEAGLEQDYLRYRQGPKPFELSFFGPATVTRPPPYPNDDNWFDLIAYTFKQWRYTRSVDHALEIDAGAFDSRVYVVARPSFNPRAQAVEGYSQQGGRMGFVQVELNQAMVDMVLAVTAHELLHTLGASDKYDARGFSVVPEGLAEPHRHPRYPQRFVEVMARNRPLGPGREVPIESLDELRVGPATAREIGWLK